MASIKQDRDLSDAAFHSKYGFMAGFDEAESMALATADALETNDPARAALLDLVHRMRAERSERRDAYVERIAL